MKEQLKSLQILRFVAATSVVYAHIGVFPEFGSFGVDIFFVISGYVMSMLIRKTSWQYSTPFRFMLSRFCRIAPLYWLVTSLLFWIIFLFPSLVNINTVSSATYGNYIKSLFFIPYDGAIGCGIAPLLCVGWTLNYEMLFYFLISLSLLLQKRIFWVSITIISFFLIGNISSLSNNVAARFTGNIVIIEFILGMVLYLCLNNFKLRFTKKFLLLLILLSYFLLIIIEVYYPKCNKLIFYGGLAFILAFSAINYEKTYGLNTRFADILVKFGNASYAVYLTHWFVLVGIRKIIYEKYNLFEYYSFVGVIISVTIVLIFGQIVYIFVDNPLHKFFTRIFSRFLDGKHVKHCKKFGL